MNLHKAPSQRDTQAIQSAKKAIEAIRNIACSNKDHKTGEKMHQPFHPHTNTEGKEKSNELTKKAIETLCFNSSKQKSMQTCEICGKTHWPLCSGGVESEGKVMASAFTTVSAEAKVQGEANLTTMRGVSIITSSCECCGEGGIEVNHLVRIDSGQLLCPDCLKALREVISKNDNSEHN